MWMIFGWVVRAYDDFIQFFFVYAKYFVALISEAVLFCGTVFCAAQGDSQSGVCLWNPKVQNSSKATEQYLPVVLFIMLCKVVLL